MLDQLLLTIDHIQLTPSLGGRLFKGGCLLELLYEQSIGGSLYNPRGSNSLPEKGEPEIEDSNTDIFHTGASWSG